MATIARNQALDLLRRFRQELTGLATDGLLEEVGPDPAPLDRLQQTDEGGACLVTCSSCKVDSGR